jgi:hypothetical protein
MVAGHATWLRWQEVNRFDIWECLLALIHTSPICHHGEESQSAGDRRFGREALLQTRSTGTEQSNQLRVHGWVPVLARKTSAQKR